MSKHLDLSVDLGGVPVKLVHKITEGKLRSMIWVKTERLKNESQAKTFIFDVRRAIDDFGNYWTTLDSSDLPSLLLLIRKVNLWIEENKTLLVGQTKVLTD